MGRLVRLLARCAAHFRVRGSGGNRPHAEVGTGRARSVESHDRFARGSHVAERRRPGAPAGGAGRDARGGVSARHRGNRSASAGAANRPAVSAGARRRHLRPRRRLQVAAPDGLGVSAACRSLGRPHGAHPRAGAALHFHARLRGVDRFIAVRELQRRSGRAPRGEGQTAGGGPHHGWARMEFIAAL